MFLAILFLFASQQSFAQQAVPTTGVHINRVTANGNGCPTGTVQTVISPDRNELSILFDNFVSQAGGNIPGSSDRKTCVMDIEFEIPDGWSMTLVGSDYRGFVALDAGTAAQHTATYSFNQSRGDKSFSTQKINGPTNQEYFFHNSIKLDDDSWSRCNARQVIMRTTVDLITQVPRPNTNNLSAQMTLDSIDSALQQKFQVAWKACTSNGNDRGGGNGRPPRYGGDRGGDNGRGNGRDGGRGSGPVIPR